MPNETDHDPAPAGALDGPVLTVEAVTAGDPARAAAALDGPPWLRDLRASAATALADVPLPSTDAEEWRYSRVAQLDAGRYRLRPGLGLPAPTAVPDAVQEVLGRLGPAAGVVVAVDGVVVHHELSESAVSAGVAFGPAAGFDAAGPLASVGDRPVDLFAGLNTALSESPVALDVPRGVDVDGPIVVVHHVATEDVAVLPRLSVRAAEDTSVTVVEVVLSEDVDALSLPVTEIAAAPAARVAHLALQDLGRRVWQVGSLVAEVHQDATLDSTVVALGGAYARLRLDCRLVGRGATGNLSSVYFGDGDQMLDLRTFQEHVARDTTSNLLFKGAVSDTSHAVYSGLIRIRPDARGTNAFQTNRILKLSEHAWAESVPNLEIENNDVRCSHASTVGPVDEDQRFYLESRGVPTEVAERLIVAGFFDEVLDVVGVPAVADLARERIDELLDRQLGLTGDGVAS